MGHKCSKHAQDDLILASNNNNNALESNPRRRRRAKSCGGAAGSSSSVSAAHSNRGIARADPYLYSLQQRSLALYHAGNYYHTGQHHLLYKQQQKRHPPPLQPNNNTASLDKNLGSRLVVRRHAVRSLEEGVSGTHIYAVRWPRNESLQVISGGQEQSPRNQRNHNTTTAIVDNKTTSSSTADNNNNNSNNQVDSLFHPNTLAATPKQEIKDWVTVSEEHNIYVADVGLTAADCDVLVQITEQVCRGQYAAYTYAKQTLGCREFPLLAGAVHDAVHRIVHAILRIPTTTNNKKKKMLALDDREPHMVKYDVSRKERQKLDMHTDKSEWTFLIALSNGCGMDYEGGGTYFECLDATVHLQRGHALVFPGKLRHCGQRITSGLRFLLVGFLVDKSLPLNNNNKSDHNKSRSGGVGGDDAFPSALHLTTTTPP